MRDYAKILRRIDWIVSLAVIAGLIYFGAVTFKWGMESLQNGEAYRATDTKGGK